jgi:hypothetical protein
LEELAFMDGLYRVNGLSGRIMWEGLVGLVTSPFLTGPTVNDAYLGIVRVELLGDEDERIVLSTRLFKRDGEVWSNEETLPGGWTGSLRGRIENGQLELRLFRRGGYIGRGMVQVIELRGSRL